MENLKKIVKFVCLFLLVIVAMYLFWHIKLRAYSMPIQHTVKDISGEFFISVGSVSEIMIKGEQSEEPISVGLKIIDVDDEIIWEKEYENVLLSGNYQTLDYFESGNALLIPEGKYSLKWTSQSEGDTFLQFRLIEYNGSLAKIYFILCILIIGGSVVIYWIWRQKRVPLHRAYIVIALALGLIYNFILPPLGAPDEESHFMEAYKLSSQLMLQKNYEQDRYLLLREDDKDSLFYLHNIASIAEWYDSFEKGNTVDSVPAQNRSTVSSKARYAYLAPALGITIARIAGMSGHTLLILGRFANLLLSVFVVSLAIKIIPYGKSFYMVLGTLPEVVYLFTSYSYDGINLSLCMLVVAYFLYLFHVKENISVREIIKFIILLVLLVPIKVVYIFFALLLFLLPQDKISFSSKLIYAILAVGIVFMCVSWGVILPTVLGMLGNIDTYDTSGMAHISIGYILDNLSHTILLYLNTFFGNADMYFSKSMAEIVVREQYGETIGIFMPVWMQIFTVFLMVVGLEDSSKNRVTKAKKVISVVIALMICFAIFTSMLFACTLISSNRIMGVQGRYFLPLFALAPIIIKNTSFELRWNKEKVCTAGIGIINMIFVCRVFLNYVTNYFA